MLCYHRTPAAQSILSEGFRNGVGSYMTNDVLRGVWFSDCPLSPNEGAKGNDLLAIDIPEEFLLPYELVEGPLTLEDCENLGFTAEDAAEAILESNEGTKPYREFLIPAELANRYGPPWLLPELDEDN